MVLRLLNVAELLPLRNPMPDKRATYLEQGPGRGFSLIELLIVVASSLIIAAIAIPNPPRAHIATNECSPAAWLPTVHTAEITYSSTYPTLGFAASMAVLANRSLHLHTRNP